MMLFLSGSGPDCSCSPESKTNSSDVDISCIVAYADSTINPIPAVMTWIVNGAYYSTDVPFMNKTDYYLFTVISTITVDRNIVNDCQCILTFGEPRDIQYEWIAMNAPDFNESCSVSTSSEFALKAFNREKEAHSVLCLCLEYNSILIYYLLENADPQWVYH